MSPGESAFSNQQLFNRFAFGYYVVDLLSFGLAGYLRKKALQKISLSEGTTLMDLMCGTGNNAKYVLKAPYIHLNYIGIDISEQMLRKAAYTYRNSAHRISLMKADIFLPLPERTQCAYVLCSYGLKCIEVSQYTNFVAAIDSALKKEGSVSLLEFQLPNHSFLRIVVKAYLHTVYRLGCLMASGSTMPAKLLLERISQQMDPVLLKQLFEEKGFEMQVEEKWMRSVVYIHGTKLK